MPMALACLPSTRSMASGSMCRRDSCPLRLWLNGRNIDPSRSSGLAGGIEIGADALRNIWVDGKRVASAAFSDDAQRVESPVLMQVFHAERCNFRAAEAHLQAYREDRTGAQPLNGVFRRGVEQSGRIRLGKGERRSFPPVNRRAFHVGDRIVFYMAVALEMLEQAGERREPATDGGGFGLIDLAHDALPGNYGAVVHLAQPVVGLDVQRPHEMLHVELVSTAGAFAFLLGEPDFLLADVGEPGDGTFGVISALTVNPRIIQCALRWNSNVRRQLLRPANLVVSLGRLSG
jgi:hypothetical protein